MVLLVFPPQTIAQGHTDVGHPSRSSSSNTLETERPHLIVTCYITHDDLGSSKICIQVVYPTFTFAVCTYVPSSKVVYMYCLDLPTCLPGWPTQCSPAALPGQAMIIYLQHLLASWADRSVHTSYIDDRVTYVCITGWTKLENYCLLQCKHFMLHTCRYFYNWMVVELLTYIFFSI